MREPAKDLAPVRPFLGRPGQPGAYQAVAQLLGILAADPELLGIMLFGRSDSESTTLGICRTPATDPSSPDPSSPDPATWTRVVAGLQPQEVDGIWHNQVAETIPEAELGRWRRIHRELTSLSDVVTLTDLEPYRVWGPQIARFSFVLSPGVDPG